MGRLFSCSLNNETETETFFSESQLRDRDRDFLCQISRSRLRPRLPLVSKSRPRFFRDSCTPLESSILRARKFDSNLTMIKTEGVPLTKKEFVTKLPDTEPLPRFLAGPTCLIPLPLSPT